MGEMGGAAGMDVTASARPPVSATEAGVRAALAVPAAIRPAARARLVFRLADARSGAPLTDLAISHEQPLHLIAVSRDLRLFQHVHPQPTGTPGEYAVEVAFHHTFPAPGLYKVWGQFQTADGQILTADIVVRAR